MIDLNYHQASEVSNNILATHEALDDALLKLSALTQSMVHASRGAGMSAGKSQKALEAISEGLSGLMVSRRGFVAAHKHMIIIRNQSNHQVTDFGCNANGTSPSRGSAAGLRAVA